jgi:prepilin-type processing-associated H-X9-DG protein
MYGSDKTNYPDTPFQNDYRIGRTISEVQSLDMKDWNRYIPPTKKIFAFCYALGPDVPVEVYPGGPIEPWLFPHNEGSIYVYIDGHAKWSETGCGWAPVHYTDRNIDRPHPHQ